MSNFLVWLGISVIIRCLNNYGMVVEDDAVAIVWIVAGWASLIVDLLRVGLHWIGDRP